LVEKKKTHRELGSIKYKVSTQPFYSSKTSLRFWLIARAVKLMQMEVEITSQELNV